MNKTVCAIGLIVLFVIVGLSVYVDAINDSDMITSAMVSVGPNIELNQSEEGGDFITGALPLLN